MIFIVSCTADASAYADARNSGNKMSCLPVHDFYSTATRHFVAECKVGPLMAHCRWQKPCQLSNRLAPKQRTSMRLTCIPLL